MKIIIAQMSGIGAMIFLCLIYQQTESQKLITAKLCADICFVVYYLCLGAFSVAIPNFAVFYAKWYLLIEK